MTKPEQRSTGRQARKPVGIGCTVVEQAEAVTATEAETVAGTRHTHTDTHKGVPQVEIGGRDCNFSTWQRQRPHFPSTITTTTTTTNICAFRFVFILQPRIMSSAATPLTAALTLSLPLSLSLSNCKQRAELKLSRGCAFTRLPLIAISAAKLQQQQHIGIHAQISQLSLCPSSSQRRLLPQPCPLFYDGKVKF